MENPVNHTIDLGLVNYVQHPSNPNYVVFRFPDEARSKSFALELETRAIFFEHATEEKKQRTYYLFAIHIKNFKEVEQINYAVEAKHKKRIIRNPYLRNTMFFFSFVVLLLASIGYCKNRNKATSLFDQASSDKKIEQVKTNN